MAKRKKVTVTLPTPLPPTKKHRIKINWRRKDGSMGNSPLFPNRQKDVVMAECLKWLAVAIDPEEKTLYGREKWIIAHMMSRGRFHLNGEAVRFDTREEALQLAAELERLFGDMWNFSSPGLMDGFVEERARGVIRRRLGA